MSFATRSGRKSGRIRYYLEIEGVGSFLASGLLPPVVVGRALSPGPDVYVTWDPSGAGPAYDGLNEGIVSPGASSAVTDAAALTIITGKVAQGVQVGGGASQMNIYGAALTQSAGRVGAWAMWLRIPSDTTVDPYRFALTQNNAFGGWYLYRNTDRTMFLQTEGSPSADYGGCGSTTVVAANVWTHVAWSIDSLAAAGAGLCKLYINGVEEGSAAGYTPNNDSVPGNLATGWPRHGTSFSGDQDEILFRRTVWTAAEVLDIYQSGVAGEKVVW